MHGLQYGVGYLCFQILRHIMRNCSIQYWFDMNLDLPDQLDIQIRPHIQLS